ncbi:5-formyltetrahydrofolate cyclo-ligase [Rivularia sp. UHCC 0363]|uniref:5-formyltetrahydrofolate cyclo-ligase n=1 Tax=Rivularia sp. UHCC 0363 TaxID=3110244 RepID=UPI002B21007A|nr:5-formyltetrahydrofolate cyclo-ligase [Rivularia sp. UHCC 0363]MEA5593690.1 5-formyltetrahydrofolate cyclo-ligase [Rivularia sp. UHCC 0363]
MNLTEHQSEKTELRRNIIKQRQSLSEKEWQSKSKIICKNLFNLDIFKKAKTVLAYFSFRQEPDLSDLFSDNTLDNNKLWGFPRCVEKSLSWHIWEPEDKLITGKYGILEPHPDAPIIDPHQVDLILVPCVACDYQGYRLGYGGGYYDRLLSSPEWELISTIGIVFDFAYLSQVPVEAWDKKLNNICTESGLTYPTIPSTTRQNKEAKR